MMHATFTDSKNRVACPASLEHGDLLNPGQIHYASRRQIEKFGLCKKCRKRMKKHGKAILNGKVETPAEIEKHHFPTVEQDHAAFDATGELVQTVDFDFDEVDRALGLVEATPPSAREQAGEVLRELFQFCFGMQRKKLGAKELKTAAMRFAVIVSSLRPDVCNQATHGELAKHLGRTKAAASKALVAFEDRHGIQFARSRRADGRAAMRAARLAQGGVNRNLRQDTGTSYQTVTNGQAEPGGMATTPPPSRKLSDPM